MVKLGKSNRDSSKRLPSVYWVEPTRLLAGEYPHAEHLSGLLAAGITTFIDLTETGELPPYAENVPRTSTLAGHFRFGIRDHGVPATPEVVTRALDTIEAALNAGERVYVHCRAGIGRTGTLVGCYLARRGLKGEAALDRLNELWSTCDRSRTWPTVPETPEQIAYVLNWQQTSGATTLVAAELGSVLDRYRGALLGLALGDALGSLLPAGHRGTTAPLARLAEGGPLQLPRGAWTADTAMTLCLAQSLLACSGSDSEDQLLRYLQWQRDGKPSSTGSALNVPAELQRTLAAWQWSRKPLSSSHDPAKRDPHTLARTLAVAMYYFERPSVAIEQAAEASRTTLQSPGVLDACKVFGAAMIDALQGRSKEELLGFDSTAAARALRLQRLRPETLELIDGRWRRIVSMPPGGDAMLVLGAVLRVFAQTSDFLEGALRTVNESPVPATAGAVFGALAGAHYGASALPTDWCSVIAGQATLVDIADKLLQARRTASK